jgi:hypothetical protein
MTTQLLDARALMPTRNAGKRLALLSDVSDCLPSPGEQGEAGITFQLVDGLDVGAELVFRLEGEL